MARRRKTKPSKPPADIAASTRRAAGKRRPGRPPVHDEAWTKVTVVLFDRQIVFLDRVATTIRARTSAAISRAQLIRAFLDAVTDANVDLASAGSEADIKAAVLARLDRSHPGA
jgi:hypothetical protein